MSKDLIATTNHICFIFLAQKSSRRSTRQTTVTYSHISVLENHLHVNYAPLRLLTRYGWSSHSKGNFSYKDATQPANSLRSMYIVTLFRYWQYHGITCCVAGVLRTSSKPWVYSFWTPFRDIDVRLPYKTTFGTCQPPGS